MGKLITIQKLFEFYPIKLGLSLLIYLRGLYYWRIGNIYSGIADFCWIYRVSMISFLKTRAYRKIRWISKYCYTNSNNIITASFRQTRAATDSRNRYSLSGSGHLDIFRDIIVLKGHAKNEKGAILIKYGETFDAFAAFFDLNRVLEKYYIVLEMSWSGTCDPSYLMFINPSNKVVIQTPEKDDFDFINDLNVNLIPVVLGSGDWVNPDRFVMPEQCDKIYDIIMIANWANHKNHKELFKALNRIKARKINVVLIGFPWGHRTKEDILNEYNTFVARNRDNINLMIKENIPFEEVKTYLCKSKFSVLLTRKEGHNKAIMEGFFMNVPAIVYNRHKGGAKEKINSKTGILSSYEQLPFSIEYMIDNYHRYTPRSYVMKNSGSSVSTRILNEKLKTLAKEDNIIWTEDISEKINNPNLSYKDESVRMRYSEDYKFLLSCLMVQVK